jgi:hypothetical protein
MPLLCGLTLTLRVGVLAGADFPSFFIGMIAYSSSLTFLGVTVFVGLVGTLVAIRRNLTSTSELDDSWPPMRQVDEKRHSFAQDEIDVLKEGSSWITSDAGSCHGGSVSAFSFSTHQTHVRKSSNSSSNFHHGSVPPKSAFWSNLETAGRISPVPPVPPLPAPYKPASPTFGIACEDPDPFRRTVGNDPRIRNGSQASWLTEPSIAPSTVTTWSFPLAHRLRLLALLRCWVGTASQMFPLLRGRLLWRLSLMVIWIPPWPVLWSGSLAFCSLV